MLRERAALAILGKHELRVGHEPRCIRYIDGIPESIEVELDAPY